MNSHLLLFLYLKKRSQNYLVGIVHVQEKLHPHPIPPTASGILEVRSLTEQMYRNPMNCL